MKVKEIRELVKEGGVKVDEERTLPQNSSLHKWCEMIAEAYNEKGLTVESVIKNYRMDLMWSKEMVKEVLIRHILRNVFGKESTTKLKKVGEIDKLIDMVTNFNAQMGIGYIEFPSDDEDLLEKQKNA